MRHKKLISTCLQEEMDNTDLLELFEILEGNTILIKADPDVQNILQNYVISANDFSLVTTRGNIAYKANNGTFEDWWLLLAQANDGIAAEHASVSPSSTKLNLDILSIRLRELDICAGLVQVFNARSSKDNAMVFK